MLRVPEIVLQKSFEVFRDCGGGKAECVVYLLGPNERPEQVDEAIHPVHVAHIGGYDVDGAWQTELWIRLAKEGRELKAQLHTHPGSAFHSSRDDAMGALQVEGFLSLVIPDFGLGEVGLDNSHLARRTKSGGWESISPPDHIVIED